MQRQRVFVQRAGKVRKVYRKPQPRRRRVRGNTVKLDSFAATFSIVGGAEDDNFLGPHNATTGFAFTSKGSEVDRR